jgi:GxxExxY protein
MRISVRVPLRRLTQQEFGDISFEVMHHVFALHNELGRFFDERIYKRALAYRMSGVRLEEPIDVTFGSFSKRLCTDVLIGDGAIFEFKAVQKLTSPHRAQLLNYLLLCDLGHGKLINIRPENVEHEFVNTTLRGPDRKQFEINRDRWKSDLSAARKLDELFTSIMKDWGAGLEISLYEDALIHFLGGPETVETDVAVVIDGRKIDTQRMRLIAPGIALKITAFADRLDHFEEHARRLLAHVDLRAIAWINFNVRQLTFTTLEC